MAGAVNSSVTLHSYDIETRKIKDIALTAPGIEYIPRIGYGDTPERLVVATLNRDQNRLEIFAVNPKSTVAKSIYVEESKAWISPETYERLHFGAKSMVVLSSRSGFAQLYEYAYTGAELRSITSGDADVTDYYGSDASGVHYYQVASPTPLDRIVCSVDAKGRVSTLSPAEGTSSMAFDPGMSMAVLCHSSVSQPPVYTLVNAQRGRIARSSDLVNSLIMPETAVHHIAERAATAAGAAAVDTHYHIALSSIILLPVIAPAVEHALRTRTAVLRHHDRAYTAGAMEVMRR